MTRNWNTFTKTLTFEDCTLADVAKIRAEYFWCKIDVTPAFGFWKVVVQK